MLGVERKALFLWKHIHEEREGAFRLGFVLALGIILHSESLNNIPYRLKMLGSPWELLVVAYLAIHSTFCPFDNTSH